MTQCRPSAAGGLIGSLMATPLCSMAKEPGSAFAVGEGRLLLLEIGQPQPAWDSSDTILEKSFVAWPSTRPDLGDMLDAAPLNHESLAR